MALQNRISTPWLIRGMSALTLTFAMMAGLASPAFAHDDNEVVTYGPNACTAVADLPAYPGATCVKHKTELDDGVTETTNSYVTAHSAGLVQQAYAKAFASNGWTIVEAEQDLEDQGWDYTVVKGAQRVKVEIEAQEPDEGTGTQITIEE